MHARDLFSLNLTSTSRNENYQYANDRERNKISHLVRPPAAILPREKDIIVSEVHAEKLKFRSQKKDGK